MPFAPFSSVVDDHTSHESEQRRHLMDFAGTLGAPMFSIETSVCLAPHVDGRVVFDGHVLFRAEPRRAGLRFWPTPAMDARLDRVQRINAGLLVVSLLDTLVVGASTSADPARDVDRPNRGRGAPDRGPRGPRLAGKWQSGSRRARDFRVRARRLRA